MTAQSDLEYGLQRLERRLNSMESDIGHGLNQIRQAIEDGTDQTVKEISRASEVSSDIEVAKQLAGLNALDRMIQVQAEAMQQEVDHQQEKANHIIQKYNAIARVLEDSYRQDVRRIGEHIYDILENDYERDVQNRLKRSCYGNMRQSARAIHLGRERSVANRLNTAENEIRSFIERRESFRAKVKSKVISNDPSIKGQDIAVPYWIVSVRLRDGAVKRSVVAPGKVVKRLDDHTHFILSKDARYDQISDGLVRAADEVAGSVTASRITVEQTSRLGKHIEELASQGNETGISNAVKKLILKELKKAPFASNWPTAAHR